MQSIDFAERGAGHRGVLSIAKVWRERGESFALCLIVLTEGSTYRKAGALAVIRADGIRCGVISGGCLESALDTGALEVLHARKSRVVVFDTQGDDDWVFGSGSGCRGRMTVLIVPIGPIESIVRAADAVFDALIHADACHLPLKLALVIEGPAQGSNDVQGMDVAHGLGWWAAGLVSGVLLLVVGAVAGLVTTAVIAPPAGVRWSDRRSQNEARREFSSCDHSP